MAVSKPKYPPMKGYIEMEDGLVQVISPSYFVPSSDEIEDVLKGIDEV